mgnify:CR=1 FL=1
MNIFDETLRDIKSESLSKDFEIKKASSDNMWSIYIDGEAFKKCSVSTLMDFITSVEDALTKKWAEEFTFYAWFDEMSGQIRFSSLMGDIDSLPFKCELNVTTEKKQMATHIFRMLEYIHSDCISDCFLDKLLVYSYKYKQRNN